MPILMTTCIHGLKPMHAMAIFFMEEATKIGFQESGIHTLSIQPISPCPRLEPHTLSTFSIYTRSERGLILDTDTLTRYFKPMEQLAHQLEIQASLYHLEKSKYASKKRNQCPWPHGCGNSQGHCSCWLTMSQQLDTCAMSHNNRTPASLAQNIPTSNQFK